VRVSKRVWLGGDCTSALYEYLNWLGEPLAPVSRQSIVENQVFRLTPKGKDRARRKSCSQKGQPEDVRIRYIHRVSLVVSVEAFGELAVAALLVSLP